MAKKSLNMIEKMMDANIIDYYIIDCAIPSIITIENCYQIDFDKPVGGYLIHFEMRFHNPLSIFLIPNMLILNLNLIVLSDLLRITQYIEKNSQNFKKIFKILVLKTPSFYLRIIVENVLILYFDLIL